MKAKLILGTLVLLASSAVAQVQWCDATVYDESGALHGQEGNVGQAALGLIAKGADVRVRSVANAPNLDMVESRLEKSCTSWQSPNGGRKSTLIVLMVAASEKKMGIYYGSAWSKALDDHWNRIKAETMGPRFKSGDYVGGFVAAEEQLMRRIVASQDEAVHPTQTTVNQVTQPTDLSGLWKFLMALLGIGVAVGAVSWIYVFLKRRREERNATISAQTSAIFARNELIEKLMAIDETKLPETEKKVFGDVNVAYNSMRNTSRGDVEQAGLTRTQYDAMASEYRRLLKRLTGGGGSIAASTGVIPQGTSVPFTPPPFTPPHIPQPTRRVREVHHHHASPPVVVNNNDGFAEGLLIGEALSDRHSRDYEPSPVRRPDPEPERSSGGSSSWFSSDSDSGGGSSSFDSGSFDSGGGGGGDSGGGGGSSDF